MSKSVELLSRSEDGEEATRDEKLADERSRLNLSGSRQVSRSATELRDNNNENANPVQNRREEDSGIIHRHQHRHISVAQRTHTFFATLKSRWVRSKSKERKKLKDPYSIHHDKTGAESDYAADNSSEHSKSSSANQSPAKHFLNRPESPLARITREKVINLQEDGSGKCNDGSSKSAFVPQNQREMCYGPELHKNETQDLFMQQDESARRREVTLRQYAFFQLRLHIRRGTNLVAMDRCGASDPYVKIKCAGRLLHKSRTVHRDLNPVWDESVSLPIEDPFQPLNIKVFDYDWGLQDDFMGAALLDLTELELGQPQDICLELKDPARPKQHLGEIFLTATLWPKNQQEKEQVKMKYDKILLRKTHKVEELKESPGSVKQKEKDIGSLRICLEKKVELIEKKLENHAERIWEDHFKKYHCLQPIEAWITERRQSSRFYDRVGNARGYSSDSEIHLEACEEELAVKNNESTLPRKCAKLNKSKKADDESPKRDETESSKYSSSTSLETKSSNAAVKEEMEKEKLVNEEEKRQDFFERMKENFRDKIEDIQRYFQRSSRLADVNRRLKSQIWSSVVTIVLVEAKNLLPMDIEGLSDPYVKFRLGTEKYKSKVSNKTLNPIWLEQFDLHLYEDPYLGQELEVTVWDRDKSHQDDLMGRTVIDLAVLERETTHRLWRDLEDGAGSIFLLLTISGTTASETISDLAAHEESSYEKSKIIQRYSLLNTLQRPRDVGHLTVKVYRAQGLAAADLGGKSDPFCVLELINSRLQTQTEYKTLAPNWQKIFTFNVKDINSVLEVTVYDEDRDHKVEFLGKVAIPLLRIRNGEKRWYALKDKKLRSRAKGNSPQILLEMTVVWNILRACLRTLNPKEKKYMEPEMKFKRQVFLRNVLRLKAIIVIFIDMGKYIQSCWEWESKMRSIIALILFVLGCYYFEPYMIPTGAFLILLKYYVVTTYIHETGDHLSDEGPPTPGDDDDDEDDKDKEEKKSLKERLQAIQEVTQTVQNSIGYIASLCERVKNLFNFTVPYLSYLAMIFASFIGIILYLIPVRYLILAWGVNKFLRKILRPHSVPNNELLDLISRVPDDEELINYRELKPVPTTDCEKGGMPTSSTGNPGRREHRKRHKAA